LWNVRRVVGVGAVVRGQVGRGVGGCTYVAWEPHRQPSASDGVGWVQVGMQRSEEGGNKWVNTDGSSASFLTSRWAMGMPNNAAGAENCVQALAVPGSGSAPSLPRPCPLSLKWPVGAYALP
jgi:hypothetical protein